MMLNNKITNFLKEFLNKNISATDIHINLAYNAKYNSMWEIKRRKIKDYLITYIADGTADYYIDGQLYHVQKGCIIFISKDTSHYANNASNSFHAIGFRFDFIDGAGNIMNYENHTSFVSRLTDTYPIIHNMDLILNHYKSDNSIEKHMCKQAAYAIVFSIHKQMHQDIRFQKLNDYVNQNITNKISHDDIAKHTNLSKNYLNKIFKEKYNMTIKHYIFTKKMEYAKYLLIETNTKILDISSHLGYSDQYIFSNMYKKYWGVSPKVSRTQSRIL